MNTAHDRIELQPIAEALVLARVPRLYRRAFLEELTLHAEADAHALAGDGIDEREAWRRAVAGLGPPDLLARAAADQARAWPYRVPWLALVAAPSATAMIAIPVLAALALTPALPASARPDVLATWVRLGAALAAAAITTVAAGALRDIRLRHTGTAVHVWWGTALVVLVAASFTASVDAGTAGPVVQAHYGWPAAVWQACPAAVVGLWPRRFRRVGALG